jgi:hypothetical protein
MPQRCSGNETYMEISKIQIKILVLSEGNGKGTGVPACQKSHSIQFLSITFFVNRNITHSLKYQYALNFDKAIIPNYK